MNKDVQILQDLLLSTGLLMEKSATGFYKCRCPVCNSDKIKAGFLFEHDHIAYHCFRGKCDAAAVFNSGEAITRKFRHVLDAFGVSPPADLRVRQKNRSQVNTELYTPHYYEPLTLDQGIGKLSDLHPTTYQQYKNYIQRRKIDHYPFLAGLSGRWKNKLIIPFYLYGNLIGWQALDIFTGKYDTYAPSGHILFFANGKIPANPVVVEGAMDALSVPNGVATLSNNITKKQAFILRNSKPILLPDKSGSNYEPAMKTYGWRMIVPDYKQKDANDALCSIGSRMILSRQLSQRIYTNPTKASAAFKMWSKKS